MRTNLSFDDALEETLRHAEQLRRRGEQITIASLNEEANCDDGTPPDAYAAGIKALQARDATTMSAVEANYKILRTIELDRERLDAERLPSPAARLTTAEGLAAYESPDPYARDLKILMEANHVRR